MAIILYDLVGKEDRRFSPNAWRTRLALAHKGLDADVRPTKFTDIPGICGGGQKTVPVIDDGGRVVCDSWAIAEYLEDTYPDRPSLFGGTAGRVLTKTIQHWVVADIYTRTIPLIALDIHDHLEDADKAYFRESREKRFGKTLEALQAGRDDKVEAYRTALHPARMTLRETPFLGGEAPMYADYLLFAALLWPKVISPVRLIAHDDPIFAWFERCLDLYGGLAHGTLAYEW